MPNYQKIRDMVSHRVTFDYDTGARVVGTIASCAPERGPVEWVVLTKAQIVDSAGKVVAKFNELPLVPNNLVGFGVTEGPL